MKPYIAALLALALAGCTASAAGTVTPGGTPTTGAGTPAGTAGSLVISEATDANVDKTPKGPVAVMPNGSIGMSFVTKQGWSLMILSPGIAAGSVLTAGNLPPEAKDAGKALATFHNEGKGWASQSGTITFEKLGSMVSGGAVVHFKDVVFKADANAGGGATGSFKLNGTVNGVGAAAI